ncbi:16S rRNA pseudouridine516 synthase [Oceanobacillus limi]|uniref:Pseudouridine synthase n=1 Tax=Oceanobacillus limi TaxID=930131 RepID=A0A1I0HF62_9BACI|nr:pseudouridine synthase [Oceanobacillus limi]SET82349.1 16S rRNA pseudouridine516 synthase [Oceanobacillus limi]
MRLDKLLANMGYGSRKDVKGLLKKKHVSVNDLVVRDGSMHIEPSTDVVKVKDEVVEYKKYIYLMMNKPAGYISATEDTREKTVIDLLSPEMQHFQPFPVGRLDKDTEGLLLLTNDGNLAHQLLSPKKDVYKTYYAKVEGNVTEEDVKEFTNGVTLDDGYVTKPAILEVIQRGSISEVKVQITEGKFHQVKRMFIAVGKKVSYLKRIRMGELELDSSLTPGNYRELNEKELSYCQSLT